MNSEAVLLTIGQEPDQLGCFGQDIVRPIRDRKPFEGFLPRSRSMFVFIAVVACYSYTVTRLFSLTGAVLGVPPRVPTFWESHGDPAAHLIEALAFAPLLESCLLVAIIALLRWLRAPTVLQALLAAAALAAPHSYTWGWEPYAFIIAPSFAMQAGSFIYWRGVSRAKAFAVVVSIHALHNLIPALSIVYAIQSAHSG